MFHGRVPRTGDLVTLASKDGHERRYAVAWVEWHCNEHTPPENLPLNVPEVVLTEIADGHGARRLP